MNAATTPKHILFVDDDVGSRLFVETLLRAGIPGVRVTCAVNGALALAVLDREPVDLLITDLEMPVMDGIELLVHVARRRLLVPVLVVTAHGSPATETLALSGGAIACIEKPLLEGPFLAYIHELLLAGPQRSRLEVVSLAGIVRLISAERKTCALRVSSRQGQGVLLFLSGELVDARQGELSGLPAARAIFAWDDGAMTLDTQARARQRTIHASVAELLARPGQLGVAPALALVATTRAEWVPASSDATTQGPAAPRYAAQQAPRRASASMPAPMPAPSSTRSTTSLRPGRPPPRLDAATRSPQLTTDRVTPPPVPAPPQVTAPPRVMTVRADPERSAAPVKLMSPVVEERVPVAEVVAEPVPVSQPEATLAPASALASKPIDYEESDTYFDLVDRARDRLRASEFEVAERLLLRALEIQPGDRVVQQNLRVLARRRGARSDGPSHSSAP